jgi:hypothetical protein
MYGFKKSSSDETRSFKIPSFLTLFSEDEHTIHLDGTVEISWTESEIAFPLECNCLITKSSVGETIVLRITYEFLEVASLGVLDPLIPKSWHREMTFSNEGRLIGERYPCLHLNSVDSMVFRHNEVEKEALVDTIKKSQLGLESQTQEGELSTKLRDSGKDFKRTVEMSASKNYDTNADELAFKFFNTVDVKRLRNGPFRGALFSIDEIVVNENDGSLVSVGLELPVGAWWLLDVRGRFHAANA